MSQMNRKSLCALGLVLGSMAAPSLFSGCDSTEPTGTQVTNTTQEKQANNEMENFMKNQSKKK